MLGRRFLTAELRCEENLLHTALTEQVLEQFLSKPHGNCGAVQWVWGQGVGTGPGRLAGPEWSIEGDFRAGAFIRGRVNFGRVALDGEFAVSEEAVFGLLCAGTFRFAGGGSAHVQLTGANLVAAHYRHSPWQLRPPASFLEEELRVGPDLVGQCRILNAQCIREGVGPRWPLLRGCAYSPLGLFLRHFDFGQTPFPLLQGVLGLEVAAEELRGQLSKEQLQLLGEGPAIGYSLALRVEGVEDRCVLVVNDPSAPHVGWGALFATPPMRFSFYIAEGRGQFETGLRLHSPESFAALLRNAAALPRVAGPAPARELAASFLAAQVQALQEELYEQKELSASCIARLSAENEHLRGEAARPFLAEEAVKELGDLRQENAMLLSVNCSLKRFCADKEEEVRAQLSALNGRIRQLEEQLVAAPGQLSLAAPATESEETFVFQGALDGQGEMHWPKEGVVLRGVFAEGRFVEGEVRWRGFAHSGGFINNRLQGPGRISDARLTLHARWEANRLPDQHAEAVLHDEGVEVDLTCEIQGDLLLCDNGQSYSIRAAQGQFEPLP